MTTRTVRTVYLTKLAAERINHPEYAGMEVCNIYKPAHDLIQIRAEIKVPWNGIAPWFVHVPVCLQDGDYTEEKQ